MNWYEEKLRSTMYIGEKLIWGLKTKMVTPDLEKLNMGWFDKEIFFTNQRILWDLNERIPSQIPYNTISRLGVEGPGSGGIAGVRCMANKGGVVNANSTYGSISIQFPDAESLRYGSWLLNEAPHSVALTPAVGTPSIEGKLDPSLPPPAPSPKSSGCFIATATFGSELAPEVVFLRRFRDEVLLQSVSGRIFIQAYERLSPPLAGLIARSDILRFTALRLMVKPIISMIRWFRWS